MERYEHLVIQTLNTILKTPVQTQELEIPPDPKMGDFAFPCFKLAKEWKQSPMQISQQLKTDLEASRHIPPLLSLQAQGPYLNFTVQPQAVFHALLKEILTDSQNPQYGSLPPQTRGKWLLEYSSPNVAKPLNIYHLRPTILGAALDRIGRYRGYHVISINHLGDWGKQYGMLITAFRYYQKSFDSPFSMDDLVNLYVKIHAEAEKNPQIEEDAKKAFLLLEQGDPETTNLWKRCVAISVQEFQRHYDHLGIHFDYILGESFYKDQLTPLLNQLKVQGLLQQSENAWIVSVMDSNHQELPPCLLQKSDGATLYATRDLAAAIYRYQKFQFDRMTYIVGAEQSLHFKQVFSVLRQMGHHWESRCEHIPFGLYRFKDAKMSTRKGNFVTLDEVLNSARARVLSLMQTRVTHHFTSSTPLKDISEKVALGAIVFHDLHTDPMKDIEFDLERMIDFDGETGPYLQYAHTRCLSILRKAVETQQSEPKIQFCKDFVPYLIATPEIQLMKTLGQFPLHLEKTLRFSKASSFAHYLIDVTRAFNHFYHECQVLNNTPPELTQARLMLVDATRRILAIGLQLIGIPLPEWM